MARHTGSAAGSRLSSTVRFGRSRSRSTRVVLQCSWSFESDSEKNYDPLVQPLLSTCRPNHCSSLKGIPKMKLQGSGPSAPKSLQSQNRPRPENRLSISRLDVVHGQLPEARRLSRHSNGRGKRRGGRRNEWRASDVKWKDGTRTPANIVPTITCYIFIRSILVLYY